MQATMNGLRVLTGEDTRSSSFKKGRELQRELRVVNSEIADAFLTGLHLPQSDAGASNEIDNIYKELKTVSNDQRGASLLADVLKGSTRHGQFDLSVYANKKLNSNRFQIKTHNSYQGVDHHDEFYSGTHGDDIDVRALDDGSYEVKIYSHTKRMYEFNAVIKKDDAPQAHAALTNRLNGLWAIAA